MTNETHALAFCKGLFETLRASLKDANAVREKTELLRERGLSVTFPEVRFCKGLILPIVDEFTTGYLGKQFGASQAEIHSSLLCEGFQTLSLYCEQSEHMSGYIGSPWYRERTAFSKSGSGQLTGANPDFAIRHKSLQVVGEVKYLPKRRTSPRGADRALEEVQHYLSIKPSRTCSWGHDLGIAIVYCGAGEEVREAELRMGAWDSKHTMVAYFRS